MQMPFKQRPLPEQLFAQEDGVDVEVPPPLLSILLLILLLSLLSALLLAVSLPTPSTVTEEERMRRRRAVSGQIRRGCSAPLLALLLPLLLPFPLHWHDPRTGLANLIFIFHCAQLLEERFERPAKDKDTQ